MSHHRRQDAVLPFDTGPPTPAGQTRTEPVGPARSPVWRLGTMGYSYADWRGPFFPRGLPQTQWLHHYAQRFSAVELNTTFHATPPGDWIARWIDAVPDEFRFAVKVNRQVTHDQPLERSVGDYIEFVQAMQGFGAKLGPLLLQLPPHVTRREIGSLELLLRETPTNQPVAVEFRESSWRHPDTLGLLREYGAAWVGLDHEDHADLLCVEPTADWTYIRLVGKHGRYDREDCEQFDPTPQLEEWSQRIAGHSAQWGGERWVLFNNDYAGHGPATLRRFAKLVDAPLPEHQVVRQQSLFE